MKMSPSFGWNFHVTFNFLKSHTTTIFSPKIRDKMQCHLCLNSNSQVTLLQWYVYDSCVSERKNEFHDLHENNAIFVISKSKMHIIIWAVVFTYCVCGCLNEICPWLTWDKIWCNIWHQEWHWCYYYSFYSSK